jgi:Histidine kinase-, DNA gyrase B-, and HSP90-like ATPase
MSEDRLLTEIERQQKYLDRLPDDFEFPLFNARQALESQRRSGYRSTAAAAREIVDNAIEAGAKRIDIVFNRPKHLKAYQRQDSISAIAFIDNGSGMLPKMARYALSWGAGTHFDDPAFIGKFGFGLPNASINQTQLVEVYTKTADAPAITKAKLDIQHVKQFDATKIEPTVKSELPEFVQEYMEKNGLTFDYGTVVVWVKPDRLSVRTPSNMREHLVDDFGVTYRYLLRDIELNVEGTRVESIDPLFLDPKARYFLPQDQGGAQQTLDKRIAVKYVKDPETGDLHLQRVEDASELHEDDLNLFAAGVIHVRVSRFPYGFASEAADASSDARRRLDIRKSRRGMSFVRADREIETIDVFPKSVKDVSKGLGKWPRLESYAYHWGVEVRFDPKLDDVFGITNDKQTVRPVEDFWRVLVSESVDSHLQAENRWQDVTREQKKKERLAAKAASEASAAEAAAAGAALASAAARICLMTARAPVTRCRGRCLRA